MFPDWTRKEYFVHGLDLQWKVKISGEEETFWKSNCSDKYMTLKELDVGPNLSLKIEVTRLIFL